MTLMLKTNIILIERVIRWPWRIYLVRYTWKIEVVAFKIIIEDLYEAFQPRGRRMNLNKSTQLTRKNNYQRNRYQTWQLIYLRGRAISMREAYIFKKLENSIIL